MSPKTGREVTRPCLPPNSPPGSPSAPMLRGWVGVGLRDLALGFRLTTQREKPTNPSVGSDRLVTIPSRSCHSDSRVKRARAIFSAQAATEESALLPAKEHKNIRTPPSLTASSYFSVTFSPYLTPLAVVYCKQRVKRNSTERSPSGRAPNSLSNRPQTSMVFSAPQLQQIYCLNNTG